MKKAALFCLMLFLFLPLCAQGESYEAVIANPSAADRLNLRKKPDEDAVSLGRFYSGTPVTVLEENENGWAYVALGDLKGYVMKDYLMKTNRNYGAPSRFYTAETSGSIALRAQAKNSAAQVAKIRGKVEVWGDIGDDWRYVYSPAAGKCGYVRTAQLKNNAVEISLAYLWANSGSKVSVYSDKAMKKVTATYYHGTPVRVIDMSRASGWAKIEIYGLPYSSEFNQKAVTGYIPLISLNVFIQPWQTNYYYQTYQTLSDISFINLYDGKTVSVPKNACVSVIGEIGDQYHIVYGQADEGSYSTGLVKNTQLHFLNRQAGRTGAGRMGYALLNQETDPEGYLREIVTYVAPGGAEDEYTWRPLAEVLSDENGFLQLRNPDDKNFFVPNTRAKVITEEQLQVSSVRVVLPGEAWTACENDEGLWTLCVAKGQRACLTVTDPASRKNETYQAHAENGLEYYSVYIPAGARVSLTGTGSLCANLSFSVLSQFRWRDYDESESIFSGSGRFFCDDSIPDLGTWLDYVIKPMPGAEESYCVLSNLFTEEGEEIKIVFDHETTFYRTNRWDLCPGAFLELHNCIVYPYYGNG